MSRSPVLPALRGPAPAAVACPPTHVLVVVPAHDEHELLAQTLRSLHLARRVLPSDVTSSVVVVADDCADATAAIARSMVADRRDLVVEITARCAGAARRAGTEAGLAGAPVPPRRVWIASTDADTLVPPEWLQFQLSLAHQGAGGVTGTVALRTDGEAADAGGALEAQFRRDYLLNADGTHHHVHGANLGLRADAYLDVGGWAALATGEDHDLWRRLRLAVPTVSTTACPVQTSARRRGRAPAGFAAGLDELAGAVA